MELSHHNGVTYLLLVGYYSNYVEVKKMSTTSASSVIAVLKDIYARFGIPLELVSGPGPPFYSDELRTFNKE